MSSNEIEKKIHKKIQPVLAYKTRDPGPLNQKHQT
jgi:hypothetical protein